jgi:hypothetical protein
MAAGQPDLQPRGHEKQIGDLIACERQQHTTTHIERRENYEHDRDRAVAAP